MLIWQSFCENQQRRRLLINEGPLFELNTEPEWPGAGEFLSGRIFANYKSSPDPASAEKNRREETFAPEEKISGEIQSPESTGKEIAKQWSLVYIIMTIICRFANDPFQTDSSLRQGLTACSEFFGDHRRGDTFVILRHHAKYLG